MTVETQTTYSFSLNNEETEKLNKAADLLIDVIGVMEKRDCTNIVSGYPECEEITNINQIIDCKNLLYNIMGAWEIRS